MSRGRTPDKRSLLAGKRFESAVSIFVGSTEALIKKPRWETLVKYFEIKQIRKWAIDGLPLKRVSEVASVFGMQGQVFTDERIDDQDFQSKLYELKSKISLDDVSEFDLETIETTRNEENYASSVPESLKGSFRAFIADRIKDFCGRQFVFDAVDTFINDAAQDNGYFLITGDPGIGKSAIISKLVHDRNYIHHFNIGLQAINTPRQFLESICWQLIGMYDLNYQQLPPDAGRDGAVLNRLLAEAADKLKTSEKLVIVIDALDEVDPTGSDQRTNILNLPAALPSKVYMVATSRRLSDIPLVAMNRETFDLEANSPANRQDAARYAENSLQDTAMKAAIAQWAVGAKDFVATIVEKSEGNFMYLRHVLPAIKKGEFKDGSLENLPQGLLDYYRHHWKKMRGQNQERFDALYKPVVLILATVKEAVSLDQIHNFTGLQPLQIKQVIEEWYEFLHTEARRGGVSLYRVYHTTFQEFLYNEVEPGLKPYHRMIADYYLSVIDDESDDALSHEIFKNPQ